MRIPWKERIFLFLLIELSFFLPQFSFAQNFSNFQNYPKNYFGSPLLIPLKVISNFGGYRENHFHSGLDLSTGGKQGLIVLASAEGYLSRVKIQSGGYGKVIYITHPNGLITVYAHLKKFSKKIQDTVDLIQNSNQRFEIDVYFPKNQIRFNKGEHIAFSGNTGNTGGPHLHFEIRDEKTEEIINPLVFGLPVYDHIKPIISQIVLYEVPKQNEPQNLIKVYTYPVTYRGSGIYNLESKPVLEEGVPYVLGIVAEDKSDGAIYPSCVFETSLYQNQKLIFSSRLLRFGFNQTRSINSFLDFPSFKSNHQKIQKSFIDPGNSLPIYAENHSIPFINGKSGNKLFLKYKVEDIAGNSSELNFQIGFQKKFKPESIIESSFIKKPTIPYLLVPFSTPYTVHESKLSLFFPKNSLFNNLIWSPISQGKNQILLGDENIPIKDSLLIRVNLSYLKFPGIINPEKFYFEINHKPIDTYLEKDSLTAWIKTFGELQIKEDTVPPYLIFGNWKNALILKKGSEINFKFGDKGSGIKSYNAYLDGKWILLDYDEKNNEGKIQFSENLSSGKHDLNLSIIDKKGNQKKEKLNINF